MTRKLILFLLLVNTVQAQYWVDSLFTLVPSPRGKAVKITQLAIGDTNTRKVSGSVAYQNGSFYVANGAYYVLVGGGIGITSLNGLLTNAQVFAFDTTFGTFGWSSSGSTHTLRFNFPYMKDTSWSNSVSNILPGNDYLDISTAGKTKILTPDTATGLMTKNTTQVVTAPKYVLPRWFYSSIEVDTIDDNGNINHLRLSPSSPWSILGGLSMTKASVNWVNFFGASIHIMRQTTGGFGYANSADTLRAGHGTYSVNVPMVVYNTADTTSGGEVNSIALMAEGAQDTSSFRWVQFLSSDRATTGLTLQKNKNTSSSNFDRWNSAKFIQLINIDADNNIRINDAKSADFNYGEVAILNNNLRVAAGSVESDSSLDDTETWRTSVAWHPSIRSSSLGRLSTADIIANADSLILTGSNSTGEIRIRVNNTAAKAAGNRASISYGLTDNTAPNFVQTHNQLSTSDNDTQFELRNPSGSVIVVTTRAGNMVLGTSSTLTSGTGDLGIDDLDADVGTFRGDVAVNGDDITMDGTTQNIFNVTGTTINAFGAGTTVNIGATTGKTTFPGAGVFEDSLRIDELGTPITKAAVDSAALEFTAGGIEYRALRPAWGEVWVADTSTVDIVIAATNVNYTVHSLSDGEAYNVTTGDSSMTVPIAGVYKVTMTLTGEFSNANSLIEASLFVNDVQEKRCESDYYQKTANETVTISFDGLRRLAANDIVKVKLLSDSAGTFTIEHINLNIHKIF